MKTCLYYQAHINKPQCWFFVAVLRSMEHMVFDRTLDKASSLFEFFVPAPMTLYFESVMEILSKRGIVLDWHKLPNRLKDSEAVV